MSTPPSLLQRLELRVSAGAIVADPAQRAVAGRLDALASDLVAWRPRRGWSLGRLLGSGSRRPPRGLYIHGQVGRGKTMLMDLFYETAATSPKRRLHFHEFMAEVHDRIAAARKTVEGDPLPKVAADIADTVTLLCFDEFHVTDIADAMILGRLLKGLFEHQVVVVATSNVAPDRLYWNGLNRSLFLPSITMIEQHMDIVELAAEKDFRLEKLVGRPLYFTPADAKARLQLRDAFHRLTGVTHGVPLTLDVKGRPLVVAETAAGVAYLTFQDTCEKPLGPLDYLHMAHAFHTIILEGIPKLSPARRNEARRLTTLVDTLYDQRVSLVVSADAEPQDLYPEGDAAFLFERTASRLIEMRSESYLRAREDRLTQQPHVATEASAGG
jgi:cell division protein ZapE